MKLPAKLHYDHRILSVTNKKDSPTSTADEDANPYSLAVTTDDSTAEDTENSTLSEWMLHHGTGTDLTYNLTAHNTTSPLLPPEPGYSDAYSLLLASSFAIVAIMLIGITLWRRQRQRRQYQEIQSTLVV